MNQPERFGRALKVEFNLLKGTGWKGTRFPDLYLNPLQEEVPIHNGPKAQASEPGTLRISKWISQIWPNPRTRLISKAGNPNPIVLT